MGKGRRLAPTVLQVTWQKYFRADLVRAIMAANRLTEKIVAERMGIHAPTVNRIKKGQSDIKLSTLVKLAAALGIEPHQLLDRNAVYEPPAWVKAGMAEPTDYETDSGEESR